MHEGSKGFDQHKNGEEVDGGEAGEDEQNEMSGEQVRDSEKNLDESEN